MVILILLMHCLGYWIIFQRIAAALLRRNRWKKLGFGTLFFVAHFLLFLSALLELIDLCCG